MHADDLTPEMVTPVSGMRYEILFMNMSYYVIQQGLMDEIYLMHSVHPSENIATLVIEALRHREAEEER